MIVLDANILVAFLDPRDAHHEASTSYLVDHADESFVVHALTLTESLVHPARKGRAAHARSALSAMDVEIVPLTPADVDALAELRATSKLRIPDAVVVLTAAQRGARLATTDAAMARAASDLGVDVDTP